jgi:hypothetical protein
VLRKNKRRAEDGLSHKGRYVAAITLVVGDLCINVHASDGQLYESALRGVDILKFGAHSMRVNQNLTFLIDVRFGGSEQGVAPREASKSLAITAALGEK